MSPLPRLRRGRANFSALAEFKEQHGTQCLFVSWLRFFKVPLVVESVSGVFDEWPGMSSVASPHCG